MRERYQSLQEITVLTYPYWEILIHPFFRSDSYAHNQHALIFQFQIFKFLNFFFQFYGGGLDGKLQLSSTEVNNSNKMNNSMLFAFICNKSSQKHCKFFLKKYQGKSYKISFQISLFCLKAFF